MSEVRHRVIVHPPLGEAETGKSAAEVRVICSRLAAKYGNPRHGNKSNPLDELVFIILSNRTSPRTADACYRTLKRALPSWNEVRPSDWRTIRSAIRPAGLATKRTRQILAIVGRLRSTFGSASLAGLKAMGDAEAEAFLTTLPGVGPKVAKCVLMYSLGRQVLPVDVHVHRVAKRLGLAVKGRPDTSQDLIEAAVPAPLRYGFHVNAVAHGRAVCRPSSPRCTECSVSRHCRYWRLRRLNS